ncbi:MAG: DUF4982 domain-containing protein, partial [Oscillospiraceae bacterium]|nr:DUF4982 domain-containing protein [Oscillospiraceae bacterium]
MNTKRLFCDGWEFCKCPIDTVYEDVSGWHKVDIPHDWLIYQTEDLYETSTGWYRRTFTARTGVRTAVRFDGVYMDSRIYVNGELAGEWKYGYSTFEIDITDFLHEGENLIAVRVDYRCPNTRWYSGAGIFRNVWYKEYEDIHIVPDGIYISAHADGTAEVTVECERPEDVGVDGQELTVSIIKDDVILTKSAVVCAAHTDVIPTPVRRQGRKYSVNGFTFTVPDAKVWDIADTQMYTLRVTLKKYGEILHEEDVPFGFRDIRFDPDKGFFLNGRHVKLHGVCEHHDNGPLGAAFNTHAFRRKLRKLRKMGVNALRTTHNMPAPEVLDLCDEMGFLVICEAFDMWECHKTDYDYATFFTEWAPADVASWVRRDRDHPCVIAWSLGNEIYDTHKDDHGQEIASRLQHLVREHDPRHNCYTTIGSNYMQWDNAQKCAEIVELAGYNYTERLYDEHHKAHPDWCIYGSETASTIQSRGIYHFPLSESRLSDDDEQCSSIGNCSTGWGAKNSEACIIADRDRDLCAGQFIWTGFDYIGEPTPYSTKNSYFGQFDICGFPKDQAYIYRSCWTDAKDDPFVHIFPYWDHMEGAPIDVRVATNCAYVELYLNGELVKAQEMDPQHAPYLTMDTIIPYTKGTLRAIAYDKHGLRLAEDTVRSFGDTAELEIKTDKDTIRADGRDLVYVEIAALDAEGTFVANARDRVFVEVSGAGRLIGVDNGDSTDYEQYKGTSRRLFSGRMLAIVAATDRTGDIYISVSTPTIPKKTITIKAIAADYPEGITSFEENTHTKALCADEQSDIPIRRIGFISDRRTFDTEHREITFDVEVWPQNASQRYVDEIEYRITTVIGIPSNLAEVVKAGDRKVTVRCKGDGEFYLRGIIKNGREKCAVIDALRLSADGIGTAVTDPYSFVIAGLHTIPRNAGNGIEKGASFAGENSWFGFENVDFGPIGSDTVTIPIYSNNTTPVSLEIFDGIPDEGGELIGRYTYNKPPQWLTYQSETYKLDKVLTGVHTLCLRSSDGYSIGGLIFERPVKETAVINATANDDIYGDKFTVGDGEITGIGNNVIIEYGTFNFETAPKRVIITGKSALAVNSIHIIFRKDDGSEKRVLAEFSGADSYTDRSFDIEGVQGEVKVSILFLPGSDFD